MKIPEGKKLENLNPFVPTNECLSLLEYLNKTLPKGVSFEDVVLLGKSVCTDIYDPEGRSNVYSIELGYLISNEDYNKKLARKKIVEQEERITSLEIELERQKRELLNMRG